MRVKEKRTHRLLHQGLKLEKELSRFRSVFLNRRQLLQVRAFMYERAICTHENQTNWEDIRVHMQIEGKKCVYSHHGCAPVRVRVPGCCVGANLDLGRGSQAAAPGSIGQCP